MSVRYALPVVAALLCLSASPVRADDFAEFRIPEHRLLRWTAGLGGSSRGFISNSRLMGTAEDDEDRIGSGGIGISSTAVWLRDSDPAFTTVTLEGRLAGSHESRDLEEHREEAGDILERTGLSRRRLLGETFGVYVSDRRYPWALPLGLTLEVIGSASYGQGWAHSRVDEVVTQPSSVGRSATEQREKTSTYRHALTTLAGVGFGRVRDVTAVYELAVLEARLRASGALVRPLSGQARTRVASLLYVRESYGRVRDRPGSDLWRELERLLREDGALREGGLESHEVLRISQTMAPGADLQFARDGLPRSPVARMRGAFIGLRAGGDHTRHIFHRDQGSFLESSVDDSILFSFRSAHASRSILRSDQLIGGVVAEYHRPMGRSWQADAWGEVMTGLRARDVALFERSRVGLTCLVADRCLANAFLSNDWQDENRLQGPTAGDSSHWRYGITALYYIEDRLSIEAQITRNHAWFRGDDAGAAHWRRESSRDHQLTLGLTYRLAGWFDAPGMFPATLQ